MLNRIRKKQEFWARKSPEYPYVVEHVKISIIKPEEYKICPNISIPTGNRERKWGFKTLEDRSAFMCEYAMRLFDPLLKKINDKIHRNRQI